MAFKKTNIEYRQIEPQDGVQVTHKLGRHVHHDERSKAFGVAEVLPAGLPIVSQLHHRTAPIYDQDQTITYKGHTYQGTGSCVAHAGNGLWSTIPFGGDVTDEMVILADYEWITHHDPFPGSFPTKDTGSDGLTECKRQVKLGHIHSYRHCFSLNDVLTALQATAVMTGTQWMGSMFTPDSSGLVTVDQSSGVAGGHQWEIVGVDVETKRLRAANSWGAAWGDSGYFEISYDDYAWLLSQSGDAQVYIR